MSILKASGLFLLSFLIGALCYKEYPVIYAWKIIASAVSTIALLFIILDDN